MRTTRLFLASVLLVALLGGQTHAFQLTGGVGAAPTRAYVHVQESRLKILASYTVEKLVAIRRQESALYAGWVVPLETDIEFSAGLVVFSEIDREVANPNNVVSSSRVVAPRADVTARLEPIGVTVGISTQGIDYAAGFDLIGLGDFTLFIGYSGWPNHGGPLIGVSARW